MPYFILALAAASILLIGCGKTSDTLSNVSRKITATASALEERAEQVKKGAEDVAEAVEKGTEGIKKVGEALDVHKEEE